MFNTLKSILYLEKDGQISHTKLWSNIGFFILSVSFIWITIYIGMGNAFPIANWLEFYISFGALVAAQRGFSKWVSYKDKEKCKCLDDKKPE